MAAISILLIIDYILTYIGIKIGMIYEGNPLMLFLFDYGISGGFFYRLIIVVALMGMLCYIRNTKYYHAVLIWYSVVMGYVMILHLIWIAQL